MLDNIPRIAAPSRERFLNDVLRAKEPVVILGMLRGQAIEELDTEPKARAALGSMPVMTHLGYEDYFARMIATLVTGAPLETESDAEIERHPGTLAEYLDAIAGDTSTRLIASEVPEEMTTGLNSLYELPCYCFDDAGERDDVWVESWIANRGNYSHLHFDADQRHILQYQVFGLKRVVLLPPSAGDRLGAVRNNCVLSPESVPQDEQDPFIASLGGWQCVLAPGETLFLPALMWHYFEYCETSMSITIRFHRNRYNRFFGEKLHFDHRLQELSWLFLDEAAVGPRLESAHEHLRALLEAPSPSAVEKGQDIQAAIERLHRELCEPHRLGRYSRAFLEPLRSAIRALEIEVRGLYAPARS